MKLHLGCGRNYLGKEWIHIDSVSLPHVDSNNVTNLPFAENSVDEIYASHLLSYFDREEGLEVLKEWNRVLRPFGKLMIAVPDFEAMAKLYVSGKWPIDDFLGPLYGKMFDIYHKTAYDERSLSKALHKSGFTKIVRCGEYDWWPSNHDQSQAYLPDRNISQGTLISLNLIATK